MQASIADRPHHHPFGTARSTPSLYASEPIPPISSYNFDAKAPGLSKAPSPDSNSLAWANDEEYVEPDQSRELTPQNVNLLSSDLRPSPPPASSYDENDFDVNDASTGEAWQF